jgi:hypothetical protein
MSGIAGSNIVSPYMAIKSAEPNIANDIQAFVGTFWFEDGDVGFRLLLLSCGCVISIQILFVCWILLFNVSN